MFLVSAGISLGSALGRKPFMVKAVLNISTTPNSKQGRIDPPDKYFLRKTSLPMSVARRREKEILGEFRECAGSLSF